MISRLRRIGRGDAGASLIIALVIVTVIALVIGATLSQASGSELATVQLRDQASTAYAADGAGQIAVNQLRWSNFDNTDNGKSCFGQAADSDGSNTLTLPNFYPGTNGSGALSAAVKCRPEDGTGAQGSPVPITNQNKPGNAILTLGQNPNEDGIHIKPLSSKPFRVHGSVVSDSNIYVTNGSLDTNAAVFAHTGCTGPITSVPPPNCTAGTVPDPGYAAEISTVPTYRPVPTTCPGGIVKFLPGYYDDANALNNLTTGNGSCGGSVWWFTPGTYYFDFHNNQSYDPSYNSLLGSGTDTWTVNRGTLLAGTPVDAAGNLLSQPPANPTVPGACLNPIDSTSAIGVQFIFGGDSQLVIGGSGNNAANAEICGTYHTDRPPIAVYGLKSGVDSTTTLSGANTLKLNQVNASDFTNASVTNLANPDHVDGNAATYATWANTKSGNQTGTVTVSGFAPAVAIPAGSVLKQATLRVVHREPPSSVNPANVRVTLTPTGGTALSPVPLTVSPSTWKSDSIDVTSQLASTIHGNGFTGASMTFSAAMKGSGSEDLDSIQLDLTYVAPALRGEASGEITNNCIAASYSDTGTGHCAVLSTSSSYAGAFYVQGTTYTPAAPIDLTLNNLTEQVLRFGVICRSLWVKETGSINYDGPVIEVPDNSPGYGTASTIVDLAVYLCPSVATQSDVSACTSDGTKLRLTGRVQLYDQSGSPPDPPNGNRQVAILGWSQIR